MLDAKTGSGVLIVIGSCVPNLAAVSPNPLCILKAQSQARPPLIVNSPTWQLLARYDDQFKRSKQFRPLL